ncbi:MAG: exo-alpha-sialidase [Caldilineaceae bacterium]|nr:exo-alpha-sialidase [Caldilineaceae bacterium]
MMQHKTGHGARLRRVPVLLVPVLLVPVAVLLLLTPAGPAQSAAIEQWMPQQRVPGYGDDTLPPVLLADRSRTVHAFTDQVVEDEPSQHAVVYSRWTLDDGWTEPVDVVLSPLKNYAQVLGVQMDDEGWIHLLFYGGDQTNANVYYTKAPAMEANAAPAWSPPVLVGEYAASPVTGALGLDNAGTLHAVFAGFQDGSGLYSSNSTDQGETWSDPTPFFLTYSDILYPWGVALTTGADGTQHAVWNVVNPAGHGVAVYYAGLPPGKEQWQEPVVLEEGDPGGLGVMHPAIVTHEGALYVAYVRTPKVVVRRSDDGGTTWSDATIPFPQHVGVNGTLAFAVDGNDDLHLLFGQRITGSPDIHGMWHSRLVGTQWSAPVPVVSGPRVVDLKGDTGFDPFDAHAVVSQGNVLLATWRTDPGDIMPNGVWYSFLRLDAPQLSVVPLPTVTVPPVPTPVPLEAITASITASVAAALPVPAPVTNAGAGAADTAVADGDDSHSAPLFVGLAPVVLLLSGVLAVVYARRHKAP